MPDEKYWREVLGDERMGVNIDILRGALAVVESIYGFGLGLYLALENIGLRKRARLGVPVISIGNLSVGGTGKTPMTQWLVRKLIAAGLHPAVLNRGHGGSVSPKAGIVSDGKSVLLEAKQSGDESNMLAHSLIGTPVIVGKDRRETGRIAIDQFGADVLVLDDGMQYWQLHRDADIVLLDARRPYDNGHALPRGFLREPIRGLRRASVIVFTRSDGLSIEQRDKLEQTVHRYAPHAAVFFAHHCAEPIRPLDERAGRHKPTRLLPVCAIGRPDSFRSALIEANAPITDDMTALPDHQAYGEWEQQLIEAMLVEHGADGIVTTEKDAVKMPADYLTAPVYVLPVRMRIDDEDKFFETVACASGIKLVN